MEKDAILNTELNTLAKYGTHAITVYEIYNGNLKSNTVQTMISFSISDDFYQNGPWNLSCTAGTTWAEWAESTLSEPIYTDSDGYFIYYDGSLQELILEARDGSGDWSQGRNGWSQIAQGGVSIQGSGWDFALKISDLSDVVAPTDEITAQNYRIDGYED